MPPKDQMTFNWKMRQNHKLTLTMFSPDTFQTSSKPQKTTTTTSQLTTPLSGGTPQGFNTPMQNNTSPWSFHSEFPDPAVKKKPPPLERMTSAPGDLEKYTLMSDVRTTNVVPQPASQVIPQQNSPVLDANQQRAKFRSQAHFEPYPRSTRNRRVPSRGVPPPMLKQQDSAPSLIQSPIQHSQHQNQRKSNRAIPPTLRALNKLSSAPNLFDYPGQPTTSPIHRSPMNTTDTKPHFIKPPLLSRNSEGALPTISKIQLGDHLNNTLPPLHSASNMPGLRGSQIITSSDSDTEMTEVEQRTSKMSIQNLIE